MKEEKSEGSGGIPILSWFDGPIKQSIGSVFQGVNTTVEALDLFGKFHRAHVEGLKQDVQSIKLLGMTTPAKLIDIYSPARVSTTIQRRLYSDEWLNARENRLDQRLRAAQLRRVQKLIEGDAFVEKEKRVAILGGPGAGKTTFLKFLAFAYIDRSVFEKTKLKQSKLPFFIPLPLFAKDSGSLFDFLLRPIQQKTNEYASAFLRKLLEKGQAIVLLDSLDEVPKSMRPDLLAKVRSFCREFPNSSMVISCRTADYTEVLESFHEVEVAKLDRGAVHKIVRAWFLGENAKVKQLCSKR